MKIDARLVRQSAAAVGVIAVLAGCGSASKTSTTVISATPSSVRNASSQHYFWIAANTSAPFYVQGLQGWKAAAQALGVKETFTGPTTEDVQQQIADVNTAIAQHAAGILMYPIDYNAIGPVLKKAVAAGIPVVLGNGDSVDPSIRTAFVGTSNTGFGATAADILGKLLNGHGSVGIVTQQALNHQQRVQGFTQELKSKYPGITIAGKALEDGSDTKEEAAATDLLQAHPDLTAMWTTDSGSGTVAKAIKLAGKAGKLTVVGSDRDAAELAAINSGEVAATVVQDTYAEEYLGLYELYWAHNHIVDVPDTLIDHTYAITKSNMSILNSLK